MRMGKYLFLTLLFFIFSGCSNVLIYDDATVDNTLNSDVSVVIEEEVFTGYGYEENQDALLLKSLQEMQDRGGVGNPDHDKEGQIYYITKYGYSALLTYSSAVNYARVYDWIDVNGSLTSLNEAIESAKFKAKSANRNLVLVYMAQGLDYWAADDTKFKSVYSSLIKDATLNGNKIIATSHSWSGHLVARLVKDNPYVTHFAFNPAHGNFKKGEKVADYVADLKATKATTYILAGENDVVTKQGGGAAWKVWWGITGYNSVYYAIRDTYKVNLIVIPKSGHGIVEMIENGAMTKLLSKI
ncbi:MAG TPA: hypothetical protein PLG34_05435 [Spirochaetota bacterium]|nr:MAG: hypothetical protein BWX91_00658 [Spirochaetes bacterium ADurb.Bin133]HNZ27547.1 hypothetical protein [Spirochaetota bacterium]HPY87406.1 hypothetical protein [Spirochaetota bacterium]